MANPIEVLNDLEDVDVPDPDDGDVLYYDQPSGLWKAKPAVGAGGIVERLVRANTDDITVYWNGASWLSSISTIAWSVGRYNGANDKMGGAARFLNIYIPKDATITHAYLRIVSRATDASLLVKTRLRGEKNATPITFSSTADYIARARTTAVIDWDDIAAWTAGTLYSSPDIKSIIEEIVALPAWASGNPLVIFWGDHDGRTANATPRWRSARSWNEANRTPPMLYIEWAG